MRFWLVAAALFFATTARGDYLKTQSVILRGVDKITGRAQTQEVPIGGSAAFGTLLVYPEACLKNPPEETPEDAAFLIVTEPNDDKTQRIFFNGWMFSSNPALSALDHPIYDVWVVSCGSEIQSEEDSVSKTMPSAPSLSEPVQKQDAAAPSQIEDAPFEEAFEEEAPLEEVPTAEGADFSIF